MQQLEVAPNSDSLNVIMELLGITFNSLYMPLLNDDEVTFILDLFWYVVMIVALCERSLFSFLYFMYDYVNVINI